MKNINAKLQESVHTLTDQLEKKKKELALARKSAATSHASVTGSLKRPLSATRDRTQKPEVEVVIGPNHHQHHAQVVHKYPEEELDDTNWHETALKLQAKYVTESCCQSFKLDSKAMSLSFPNIGCPLRWSNWRSSEKRTPG